MSKIEQLKAAAGGAVASASQQPKTVFTLLKNNREQIAAALPKHMNAERMARVAMTCIRTTPKLLQCSPESLFGAVIQCAQLGLEPSNGLGHAYLLPFDKREKGADGRWHTVGTDVQLIIGYRGMIDLARRSGQIISIEARAVYEGDVFECSLGLDSSLVHKPDWDNPNRGNAEFLRFVYAVAKLKDGGVQFEVLSRQGVEAIRARSKAGNSGPWATDYEAMALKSVTRRLFKWLPVSIEMQAAVGLDEAGERGEQHLDSVLNGDFKVVADKLDEAARGDDAPDVGEVLKLVNSASTGDELDLALDLASSLNREQFAQAKQAIDARRAALNN